MPTVLIIEDMDDLRGLMGRICTAMGYEVIEARNGEEGIQSALSVTPALIIVDLAMPFVNGASVIGFLRASETLKHIPIIFVSALPGADQVAKQYDAEVFLSKPFSPDDLRQAIARVRVP